MLGRRMCFPHEIPLATPNLSPDQPEPSTDLGAPPSPPRQQPNNLSRGPYLPGDTVLTRRPQVPKEQSSWGRPLQVVSVLGRFTYHLSDGQQWTARKMRRYIQPDITWDDAEPPASPDAAPPASPMEPRRFGRENQGVPPRRFPE